jgi:serine phosphatase RsbU (regulator of sigma subunit)
LSIAWLLLGVLLTWNGTCAQAQPIDSLRQAIAEAPTDSAQAKLLTRLGGELVRAGQRQQALDVLQQALVVARRSQRPDLQALVLMRLNTLCRTLGKDKLALESVLQALEIRRNLRDTLGTITSLQILGATHRYMGDYTRAIESYLEALRLVERVKDDELLAGTLNNMGNVYRQLDEYAKAYECYNRALAIRKRDTTQPRELGTVLGNLGNLAFRQGNYPEALRYYEQGLVQFTKARHTDGMAHRLNNIGQTLARLGRYGPATDSLKRSLALLAGRESDEMRSEALTALAEVYFRQGRAAVARPYIQQGLPFARRSGNREQLHETTQLAYRIDSALGLFGSAFWHLLLYQQLSDSMKNDSQAKAQGRLESKYEFDKQAERERLRLAEEHRLEAARTNWLLGSVAGGLLLVSIVAFTLFKSRRRARQANATLRRLYDEITQQKAQTEALNAELQATLQEVSSQRQRLETQHAQIEDSIQYASRIQQAILPSPEQLAQALPQHFIHYQPRDIVSGDFYWIAQQQEVTLLAVVDCTGHGVPGAFMSVVGTNLLQQIVADLGPARPGAILKALDRRINRTLHQHAGSDSKDGMDVCMLVIGPADEAGRRRIDYAGAGRPLWLLRGGQVIEYRSARYPCGGNQHLDKQFPVHTFDVEAGDRLYAFSDGVVDQFGGPAGRKLGTKRLQALITESVGLSLADQGQVLVDAFADWRGARFQVDDVLLVGLEM